MSATSPSETKFWVICRDDNPLAYQLAKTINDWQISGVRARVGHQMPLGVSDAIAQADSVIFVTTRETSGSHVSVMPVSSTSANTMSKAVQSPVSFLNTLRKRYGRIPQAWWLQLPTIESAQSGVKTVPAEYILSKAVSKIEVFVRNHYIRHQAFQADCVASAEVNSVEPVSMAA
ncbi:MAG: hypothetical protein AAFN40_10500 [Cyanobacteria bacterium J06560_6]